MSLSLAAVNQSAINMRPMIPVAATTHDDGEGGGAQLLTVPRPATTHDDGDGGGAQLLTVPRPRFLTVDDMKQAASIETLASDEDDHYV